MSIIGTFGSLSGLTMAEESYVLLGMQIFSAFIHGKSFVRFQIMDNLYWGLRGLHD